MEYPVSPAGDKPTAYSPETLVALFTAHTLNLCSERETIWLRYSAMLVGNAALLGFFTQSVALGAIKALFITLLGMALCLIWEAIIVVPWDAYDEWVDKAAQFSFVALEPAANPFSGERTPLVRQATVRLIYIFMASYWFLWGIYMIFG